MGIFAGTAQYYDLYRPGVPTEVVERIVAALKDFNSPTDLLDLGTGTGKILEQFLPHFSDVIAVEPADEMMALAKRRLVPRMAAGSAIHFVTSTAENVEVFLPDDWHASLVTICRSFHWMDRDRVLAALDRIVEPNGMLAIFSDRSMWTLDNDWCDAARLVIRDFLGETRRAGSGLFEPPVESYQTNLAASAFTMYEEFTIPVERTWNVDQIIGYLYSTSFAAKALFGDKVELFERTLRDRLAPLANENGKFVEQNEFTVLLARRP